MCLSESGSDLSWPLSPCNADRLFHLAELAEVVPPKGCFG